IPSQPMQLSKSSTKKQSGDHKIAARPSSLTNQLPKINPSATASGRASIPGFKSRQLSQGKFFNFLT
ncbi:MAG: hypothetical protein KGQ79_11395, partial [Proteobacteria bacterium]|nr:hypothetical protein [Pseudomonadota bacterium]